MTVDEIKLQIAKEIQSQYREWERSGEPEDYIRYDTMDNLFSDLFLEECEDYLLSNGITEKDLIKEEGK